MPELLEDYLTKAAAAAALAVTERTLDRYSDRPDGLPKTMIGGRTYYRKASLQAWVLRQERQPNPTTAKRRSAR